MTILRTGAVAAGIVVLALLLPACATEDPGAQPGSPTVTAVTQADRELEHRQCLREHGIEVAEPEPGQDPRGLTIEGDPDSEEFREALQECQQDGGGAAAEGDPQERRDQALAYARCMRENGVDMPDPAGDSALEEARLIDPAQLDAFEKADAACSDEAN